MSTRRPSVFFAIPCGEFYDAQHKVIKDVCDSVELHPEIIEDYSQTEGLWKRITDAIDSSDFFVADISSKSPNVILELGYATKEKSFKYYAIFIADSIDVPVDLQGFTLQIYKSTSDFRNKLVKWFSDNIPGVDEMTLQDATSPEIKWPEGFMSYESLNRNWAFPPNCSYLLTHEGLRFGNADFPLMTTHLALLNNYEFEFKARIESQCIGWIVKGTRHFTIPLHGYLPTFCVMFNMDREGNLKPHILNVNNLGPNSIYHIYDQKQVVNATVNFSPEGWFTIVTRVTGDEITILNEGREIFKDNFGVDPYRAAYQFPNKQGEVGFRCHPGEQAIVRYVHVREITTEET